MKINKKNLVLSLITILISVLVVVAVVKAAAGNGTLAPAGSPAATMNTLDDIYTRLTTNAVASTHTLTPGAGPANGLFHTLAQIYSAIPTIDPTKVLTGTTYLGVPGSASGATPLTLTLPNPNVGGTDTVTGGFSGTLNIYSMCDDDFGKYIHSNFSVNSQSVTAATFTFADFNHCGSSITITHNLVPMTLSLAGTNTKNGILNMDLDNSPISSITIGSQVFNTGSGPGAANNFNFNNCSLSSAQVNYILHAAAVNVGSTTEGTLNLGGNDGAPTNGVTNGPADKATLVAAGWTVTTN